MHVCERYVPVRDVYLGLQIPPMIPVQIEVGRLCKEIRP
jgi:hypothetical protein